MTGRRNLRWGIGAAVLLVHLLLLWAWPPGGRAARDSAAHAPSTIVHLLPATAVVVEPDRPLTAPRDASTTPARDRQPPTRAPALPIALPPPAVPAAAAAIEIPAAEPSASVPLDLRLRLPRGAAAERGGLTEPRDSMRRAALNDPRSNVVVDPTQALPRAVAASTKGDCMKGEYAGGGMGLLSLPFLALAAVRDGCRPSR